MNSMKLRKLLLLLMPIVCTAVFADAVKAQIVPTDLVCPGGPANKILEPYKLNPELRQGAESKVRGRIIAPGRSRYKMPDRPSRIWLQQDRELEAAPDDELSRRTLYIMPGSGAVYAGIEVCFLRI